MHRKNLISIRFLQPVKAENLISISRTVISNKNLISNRFSEKGADSVFSGCGRGGANKFSSLKTRGRHDRNLQFGMSHEQYGEVTTTTNRTGAR